MATLLYLIAWAAFFVLYGWLLDAFVLGWRAGLLVLALVGSFATAFAGLLLFLWVYALIRRNKDPFNPTDHRVVVSVMRLLIRLLRLRVDVSGLEKTPEGPFVLVSNHQTLYDILVLKAQFKNRRVVFIAKEEIFSWPVIGRWTRLLGNIPITRMADRSAAKAILEGIKAYEQGVPVIIFPEGERSHSPKMRSFRSGAFKLAMRPKADILVASLRGVHRTWRGWPFVSQNVQIRFGPLLKPADYQGMNSAELSEQVREIIRPHAEEHSEG